MKYKTSKEFLEKDKNWSGDRHFESDNDEVADILEYRKIKGLDEDGFDKFGFNEKGFDREGYDCDGDDEDGDKKKYEGTYSVVDGVEVRDQQPEDMLYDSKNRPCFDEDGFGIDYED